MVTAIWTSSCQPAGEELTTARCYSAPTACWVAWSGGGRRDGNHLRQSIQRGRRLGSTGLMDIARIAQTGQSYLYTSVLSANASNWTIGTRRQQGGTTSGVAAMDYDWDGAVDVLVTKQSGSVFPHP